MKIFSLLLIVSISYGQTIQHHNYKTYYNAKIGEPDSVSWNLTSSMLICTDKTRKDAFAQDPLIPNSAKPSDYTNSHYDKGHLFNFDDAVCNDVDKKECFYMSNMLPQIHAFNAGDWKTLEVKEREWAKTNNLHIIAGGIGSLGKLAKGENIPAFMWKAILVKGTYIVWIMPNSITSVKHQWSYWETDLKTFDAKTGLKL